MFVQLLYKPTKETKLEFQWIPSSFCGAWWADFYFIDHKLLLIRLTVRIIWKKVIILWETSFYREGGKSVIPISSLTNPSKQRIFVLLSNIKWYESLLTLLLKKTGKEKWEVHTESKCTYIPSVMTCLSEQNGIISSGKDHFILLPQSLTSSESKYKGQHWALFCTLQGYDWWYKTVDGSRLLEHKAFKCLFLLWMWCTLVMNMLGYSNLRQKKEFYFWGIIHSCEQDEAANVWGWGAALPAVQHSRLGAATESGCAQGLYGKYPQSWEQRGWKVKLCGDVSLQYVQ